MLRSESGVEELRSRFRPIWLHQESETKSRDTMHDVQVICLVPLEIEYPFIQQGSKP